MLLIGDVHGKIAQYKKIVLESGEKESIQLGDMGFDYSELEDFPLHTGANHMFFFGNHDNPNAKSYHRLSRFGYYKCIHQDLDLFYIGGADSIDKQFRIEGLSWWKEEELNYSEAQECLDQYAIYFGEEEQEKTMVLSHDCPQFLANGLLGYHPSYTRKLLDGIWHIQKPRLWVFGHHHKHIDITIEGCRFVCLNELETMVI